MMIIKLNGEPCELAENVSIDKLIGEQGLNRDTIAVEHNRDIVPKENWANVPLKAGDSLEIISFMGGGAEEDTLEIGGKSIKNRFFIGTGKFASNLIMRDAIEAAGAEVVTVALRRLDLASKEENILEYIPKRCTIMVNTSGARDAEEALRIARLARAGGCGDWIKLEVISDNKYLLPDNAQTLKAVELLAKEGFVVFPYMNPDLMAARRMIEAGAACVMPLGSPIGTSRGFKTEEIVRIMVSEIKAPVIVDAGIASPSEASRCMEIGCAAVLANTALAVSDDPVKMAVALAKGVEAGRIAYLAGSIPSSYEAKASSPLTGFLR